MITNVHTFICFFSPTWAVELYRGPDGRALDFDNHSQASEYILSHRLDKTASPVEISEVVIPVRNHG